MSSPRTLGIIGGSGLYAMDGLIDPQEIEVPTPFGKASDKIIRGKLGDVTLLFLPRHGRGHRLPPGAINYRANVLSLKMAGAEQILSVSAVGSMREEIRPGELVVVDQFIDRTTRGPRSYFDEGGAVAHVSFADPVDAELASAVAVSMEKADVRGHKGGTYVCIEGPQFSTRAESKLFRSWGADVIGMTNLPEARLAREAQMPYATLAIATDYDCWHEAEEDVSVEAVIAILQEGMSKAQRVIRELVGLLPSAERSPARSALRNGLLQDVNTLSPEWQEKIEMLLR